MIERFRFDAAAAPARDDRFKDLDRAVFAEEAAVQTPRDRRNLSKALYGDTKRQSDTYLARRPNAGRNANQRPSPPIPDIAPADRAAKARLLAIARNVEDAWIRKHERESAKGAGA